MLDICRIKAQVRFYSEEEVEFTCATAVHNARIGPSLRRSDIFVLLDLETTPLTSISVNVMRHVYRRLYSGSQAEHTLCVYGDVDCRPNIAMACSLRYRWDAFVVDGIHR